VAVIENSLRLPKHESINKQRTTGRQKSFMAVFAALPPKREKEDWQHYLYSALYG
jgi:hypothetical protein